ncbi:MAG TPA: glycosyltransferase family 4 protein [Acetobacteraceae bacterium]|nr:glycosyltransferase family 4 protein [Acetobacteraceae bacterium]
MDAADAGTPPGLPPGPARRVLGLPGQTSVAWAVFDAAHYTSLCASLGPDAPAEPAAALCHYFDHGQAAGLTPNRWFDEAGARAAIRDGEAESGFDTYCRASGRGIAPHWLFDEALYLARYPDLTEEALRAGGFANGYDHYLRVGDREGRSGSLFLDPAWVRAHLSAAAAGAAAAQGCFAWYLDACAAGGAEPTTTPWFDPAWYLARHPEAAPIGALHHYLTAPAGSARDPLPWFSEAFYLARYPDVAEAVRAGIWRSGYQHFLHHGAFELRSPCAALDLAWYAAQYPAVRAAIESGVAREAYSHFLLFGRQGGLAGAPLPDVLPDRAAATALLARRAAALLPGLARTPLDFTCAGPPDVAVVMVLRDGFAAALAALATLRGGFAGAIELILVDAGSTDETRQIARYARGAAWLGFAQDIGWLRGANAGLAAATASVVLFLSPAVELLAGSLAAGLARLGADATAGAVGGRRLRPEGVLADAGLILWRDGSLSPYQAGAHPLAPEATFLRPADACAPGLLFARREDLAARGGFDTAFADAPEAAVAELGLLLAADGLRLLYDPAVAAQMLLAAAEDEAAEDAPRAAAARLVERHAAVLRFRFLPDPKRHLLARTPEPAPPRLLFIDDMAPVRRAGSGFVRSADLLGAMAELGWAVSVLGMQRARFDLAAQFADLPETVELLHDRGVEDVEALLGERAGFYDAIWIARTHNLRRLRPALERALAGAARRPAIVLDTEAIASLRAAERARITAPDQGFDLDAALAEEFADAGLCRHVVAVSEAEASVLRQRGLPSVSVIGHVREVRLTPRPFAARSGLLFLGAMHEPSSPNHDALAWFVDAVLPRIAAELGWETQLTVAGYLGPEVDLEEFAAHPRISLRGPVGDVVPLYNAHRVFVAPTRFAAGLPYKLHEAASFGVPIVATGLLARQLGWEEAVLTAEVDDPAGFAAAVVRLYRDPALWERLRAAAAALVAAETGQARTLEALRTILA